MREQLRPRWPGLHRARVGISCRPVSCGSARPGRKRRRRGLAWLAAAGVLCAGLLLTLALVALTDRDAVTRAATAMGRRAPRRPRSDRSSPRSSPAPPADRSPARSWGSRPSTGRCRATRGTCPRSVGCCRCSTSRGRWPVDPDPGRRQLRRPHVLGAATYCEHAALDVPADAVVAAAARPVVRRHGGAPDPRPQPDHRLAAIRRMDWARAAETELRRGPASSGFEIGTEPDIYSRSFWLTPMSRRGLDRSILPTASSPDGYAHEFPSYARLLWTVCARRAAARSRDLQSGRDTSVDLEPDGRTRA